jgi:hypothetical protein
MFEFWKGNWGVWRHYETPTDGGGGAIAKARAKADDPGDVVRRLKELETALAQEEEAKRTAQQTKMAELEQKLMGERRERALAQVGVQYPLADRDLVTEYPSQDPDQILAYAAKLHEKAQLRNYDANGVPFPPTNQTDAALTQEQSQLRRWQIQLRNNHLRKTMDPIEAEQAFETFFRRAWNDHMEARKRRAGMPVAPIAAPSSE